MLTIQAVDLAHNGNIATFIIASSDSDFGHLAHYLRERNFTVIGIGEEKAKEEFRAACTSFILLEVSEKPSPTPPPNPLKQVAPSKEMDKQIRAIIRRDGNNGQLSLVTLGAKMFTQHKVSTTMLKEANWRKYFEARPQIYECDPSRTGPCVKLKQAQTSG